MAKQFCGDMTDEVFEEKLKDSYDNSPMFKLISSTHRDLTINANAAVDFAWDLTNVPTGYTPLAIRRIMTYTNFISIYKFGLINSGTAGSDQFFISLNNNTGVAKTGIVVDAQIVCVRSDLIG